jgi:indolepyruvate ferredoxin oxidoreductase beta subunit
MDDGHQELMSDSRQDWLAERPIALAIVAMGGQGGGVLGDWIAAIAEANGYIAQATSVPGVAQRTGATIYYLEMMRRRSDGVQPVLALMPVPGDVDVVIASELMEAGRAILRGLVTPDRTTLIASSQRAYAVAEKEKPGDGTGDGTIVIDAVDVAAKRRIVADFARIAEQNGSVISASLLGALAASRALPFPRAAFEQAIRDGGLGVDASLKAFAAAFDAAGQDTPPVVRPQAKKLPDLPGATGNASLDALVARIRTEFPLPAQRMIFAGVRHLVDFQDVAYAREYLDELSAVTLVDRANGGERRAFALTTEVARQLARAMAYDDIIRVADLKTRSARAARVAREVGVDAQRQVLQTTEYFHPRMEEVCSVLPAWLGGGIERRAWLFGGLDKLVDRGRRVRTDSVWGFLQLYLIAGRKAKRRGTLRHGRELTHIKAWLATVSRHAATNYDLAVEVARARRLIKGYSDTMSRGLSKYDRVLAGAVAVAARQDAADWVRRLRQAALVDEQGLALDGALKTIATLKGTTEMPKREVAAGP